MSPKVTSNNVRVLIKKMKDLMDAKLFLTNNLSYLVCNLYCSNSSENNSE